METRARYALIGLFTVAVVLAGFAFVYWIQNAGGLGQRSAYRVRFDGSVSGLLVGSNVLFNGLRVGEVTALELDKKQPKIVMATLAVDAATPIRRDSSVGMDFQGLTGAPVVILSGGSPDAPAPTSNDGLPPLLVAAPNAGQTLTQSATSTLKSFDKVMSDNAEPLHTAVKNFSTFSDVLSRNSERIDGILAGLERMTGGAAGAPPTPIYSLTVPAGAPTCADVADLQLVVPEPGALMGLSTNKIPVIGTFPDPHAFDKGLLADTMPALVQAKVVESLENSRCFRSVTRNIDGLQSDLQLVLDIRNFSISPDPQPKADLDVSAKVIANDGKILGSTVIRVSSVLKNSNALEAAAALDDVFGKMIRQLTPWVASVSANRVKAEIPPP
jgi:phospholipid/cholesterol/gamma-HCH transport system substrate-binding protein